MTLRDADRFKDKVEVSLDTRQIFFLFFGGAVVACLVFVLGVMVGRRLESREQLGKKAATSAAVDPLAALDELGADEKPAVQAAAVPSRLAPASAAGPAAAAPAPAPAAAATAPPAPAEAARPIDQPAAKPPGPVAAAPKPADKPADKPAVAASGTSAGKKPGKYTLQLSSFQDRAEAEAFLAKVSGAGYKPYIVESVVPDRGTFYRVRLGEYPDHDTALTAKSDFEKSQHIIAYVTRL
jgi:cell division septation protein DedD